MFPTLARASTDERLIDLWLHGHSPHTQRSYAGDVARLQRFTDLPLGQLRLEDLYDFQDTLGHLADGTQQRIFNSIKSLLSFGTRLGYLPFNVGAAWRWRGSTEVPVRFLEESSYRMIVAAEPSPRNRTLLRFLYASGARVAEACAVTWGDIQMRDGGRFQVLLHGKGKRDRVILLPADLWPAIAKLSLTRGEDEPLFRSKHTQGHMTTRQMHRIVTAAATRVGLHASPHWFRHSHATHALEAGVSVHIVQATLGHARLDTTGRYLHARPTQSSALALNT